MNRTPRFRAAITLIELLVVIAIVALLAVSATQFFNPGGTQLQVEEGARMTSTALGMARARAAELRRPVGVQIVPYSSATGRGNTLRFVEVPPPYAGPQYSSRIHVVAVAPDPTDSNDNAWTVKVEVTFYRTCSSSPCSDICIECEGKVKVGDQVKFNYRGLVYDIVFIEEGAADDGIESWYLTQGNRTILKVIPSSAVNGDGDPIAGLPFQIFRQPTPNSMPPIELPGAGKAVVDLEHSGPGDSTFSATGIGGVTIMFAPQGHVDSVYVDGAPVTLTDDMIYLLVGSNNPDDGDDTTTSDTNLVDVRNRWVAISRGSGLITVAHNVHDLDDDDMNPLSDDDKRANRRREAREGHNVRGG